MRFPSRDVEDKDDSVVLIISAVVIASISWLLTYQVASFQWILFLLYAVFIFMGQYSISFLLFRKSKSLLYTCISITSGSTLGILFVVKAVLPYW